MMFLRDWVNLTRTVLGEVKEMGVILENAFAQEVLHKKY
jgi:hypothetical protein